MKNRLNILIKDILEDNTFLQEAFLFEFHLASLVKMNILIAEDRDLSDSFNRPKYSYPTYQGLLDDELINSEVNSQFYQIITYQNELKEIALSRQQMIG